MNPIILNNHVTSSVVTKEQINQICPTVLSKMRELGYNETTCYQVAAIHLFLITLRRDEYREILKVLHLTEK